MNTENCSSCGLDSARKPEASGLHLCRMCCLKKLKSDTDKEWKEMDKKLEDHSSQGLPIDYFKKAGTQAANRALELLESNLKPVALVWGDLQLDAKKTLYRALKITIPILEAELEEELRGPASREYVVDSIRAEINRTRVLASSLKTSIGTGP